MLEIAVNFFVRLAFCLVVSESFLVFWWMSQARSFLDGLFFRLLMRFRVLLWNSFRFFCLDSVLFLISAFRSRLGGRNC